MSRMFESGTSLALHGTGLAGGPFENVKTAAPPMKRVGDLLEWSSGAGALQQCRRGRVIAIAEPGESLSDAVAKTGRKPTRLMAGETAKSAVRGRDADAERAGVLRSAGQDRGPRAAGAGGAPGDARPRGGEMSRIRPARLSRRESLIAMSECGDTLANAAAQVVEEADRGRFDLSTGYGAAMRIAAAFRDTAPGYLKRSRLQSRGARR